MSCRRIAAVVALSFTTLIPDQAVIGANVKRQLQQAAADCADDADTATAWVASRR